MRNIIAVILVTAVFFALNMGQKAIAHCDTKSGPVISAAKEALNTGNVNLVLIWVQKTDEEIIKEAFNQTLKVRKLNNEAKDLADNYFFETLVRIHRQGEGVAYTGIKDIEEVELPIKKADEALESGSVKDVKSLLMDIIDKELTSKFNTMMELKNYNKNNVEAGRKLVEKYVEFMHYVEKLYNTANPDNKLHNNKHEHSVEHK